MLSAASLLNWYDRNRRHLPWRAAPGAVADPYRVWLSEIMLQQTTVAVARSYYESWTQRFPTLEALAAAPEQAVLSAWAGLGYYARARNLIACARLVAQAGGFPRDLAGLRALPGIGPYSAAAIGAIAFGIPVVPVDGNIARIAARCFAIAAPMPAGRKQIEAAAATLGDDAAARARPGDFAQALFDLGATICTPARPACGICPWREGCEGHRQGLAESLPVRPRKKARPHRWGAHFWLQDGQGRVLLRQRPAEGLLGGMTELPGTPWRSDRYEEAELAALAPAAAAWRKVGEVRHVFTHFTLAIDLYAARLERVEAAGFWRPVEALAGEALPSVMRKCAALMEGG